MGTNWFQGCQTVGSVKTLYRHLAMKHHPDHGGNTATMQDINLAYHAQLKRLDGEESFDAENKVHVYRYYEWVEQAVMDKLFELLKLKMKDVQIELVGTWIWVSGNTKPYKDLLGKNGAGCMWHSKRNMWYWRRFTYRREYSGMDMDTLRRTYGGRIVEESKETAMAVMA